MYLPFLSVTITSTRTTRDSACRTDEAGPAVCVVAWAGATGEAAGGDDCWARTIAGAKIAYRTDHPAARMRSAAAHSGLICRSLMIHLPSCSFSTEFQPRHFRLKEPRRWNP